VVPVATTTIPSSMALRTSGRAATPFAMSLLDSETVRTTCLFMALIYYLVRC